MLKNADLSLASAVLRGGEAFLLKEGYMRIIINSPKYGTKEVLIDKIDYKKVMAYTWHMEKRKYTFYATTNMRIDGKVKSIRLHQFILKSDRNKQIDHRNMNGLDCRRSNMRICTPSQNRMNRTKQQNNKTGYKGISFDPKNKRKYVVHITVNRKVMYIGFYSSLKKAVQEYSKAAKKYHGEFARLK